MSKTDIYIYAHTIVHFYFPGNFFKMVVNARLNNKPVHSSFPGWIDDVNTETVSPFKNKTEDNYIFIAQQ